MSLNASPDDRLCALLFKETTGYPHRPRLHAGRGGSAVFMHDSVSTINDRYSSFVSRFEGNCRKNGECVELGDVSAAKVGLLWCDLNWVN